MLPEKNIEHLKTITWGLKSSLNDSKTDAYIAKKLTKKMNVQHKFYHTDLSKEPIEKILDRFIKNGEGRIDHISGYLDGFNIWKTLHDENIQGIIRGDEGFGWLSVHSTSDVRNCLGLNLCSDYENLKKITETGFYTQVLPDSFKKSKNESIEKWRDRLYYEYRIPTILAALSDLKLSYVELINPLQFKSILDCVRIMPDSMRTNKLLFRKIVKSVSPKIPYASRGATASFVDVFKSSEVSLLLKKTISNNKESLLFPENFLVEILENIKTSTSDLNKSNTFFLKSFLKSITPYYIKSKIRNNNSLYQNNLDYNTLAFRVFMILKMEEYLSALEE
jgi:hypothetical protein